jgi:hypothetical protein
MLFLSLLLLLHCYAFGHDCCTNISVYYNMLFILRCCSHLLTDILSRQTAQDCPREVKCENHLCHTAKEVNYPVGEE